MKSPLRKVSFAALLCVAGCGNQAPAPEAWLGDLTPLRAPAAPGARYPYLARGGGDAPVVMSWVEPGTDGRERLRFATLLEGTRWSEAATVAEGAGWSVNWADSAAVVPLDASTWAAYWLTPRPGSTYARDVITTLSSDGGRHWSTPASPHDDGTLTEHGFVTFGQRDGRPYAVWLDGRNTAAGEDEHHGKHDDKAASAEHSGHRADAGAMTLRGATLSPTGSVDGTEIDARVCDCCQTDGAATSDAMLIVYRDRSDDEVRDIHATRLGHDGSASTVAVNSDGWRIAGCPVNGPAVDAHGNQVAVAWFTAPDQPRVRLAFSRDGGRTFDPPLEVAQGKVAGRVDVVVLEDGRAVVSWLAETPGGAAIFAQPFSTSGPAGTARVIATSDVARASGFPRMVRSGNRLLFAWTRNATVPQVESASALLR